MCGRYTIYEPADKLVERFLTELFDGDFPPRYNVAPTDTMPIVTQRPVKNATDPSQVARRLEMCRWGLVPSWADDPSVGSRMINARSETLAEKPAFRKALLNRRCIVPANGFYEWKMAEKKSKAIKQPAYVRPVADGLLGMAGLWDVWRQPDGTWLKSYTIITVPANDVLRDYHIRMPAILRRVDEDGWLDHEIQDVDRLNEFLRTTPPTDLDVYPVSSAVNTAGFDVPSLIVRVDSLTPLTLDF